LSEMFPIKNCFNKKAALSPLFLNFVLAFAFRRGQVNQDGLKLNGTYQLLVYTDMLLYWVEAYILLRNYLLVRNLD